MLGIFVCLRNKYQLVIRCVIYPDALSWKNHAVNSDYLLFGKHKELLFPCLYSFQSYGIQHGYLRYLGSQLTLFYVYVHFQELACYIESFDGHFNALIDALKLTGLG